MTTMQKLAAAFWIFVVIMCLWSFRNYNQGLTDAAHEHPAPQHFYFVNSKVPGSDAPKPVEGARVVQTSFTTQLDTPGTGSFTCLVTVKNTGNAKATNVQVRVRPYRGVSNVDIDVGGNHGTTLTEDDPISQLSDYLSFPDLAPGESNTQNDVFTSRTDFKPGINPNPTITFNSEKPTGAPPPAPPRPSNASTQ